MSTVGKRIIKIAARGLRSSRVRCGAHHGPNRGCGKQVVLGGNLPIGAARNIFLPGGRRIANFLRSSKPTHCVGNRGFRTCRVDSSSG